MKDHYFNLWVSSFLVLVAVVGAILAPFDVLAQSVKSLAISPLTFELTANPGGIVSNVLKVYNNNDFKITANLEVEDFAPAGESGQAVVTEPQETNTYSLARWISVGEKALEIEPQSYKPVTFYITVPANAEPGGHYGTVLASIGDGATGGGGVGVASKVGALLLLQVAGTTRQNLEIASMEAPAFSEYGPITISSRFKNTGTVHLKPRGFIIVTNMLGRETARLNLDQKNILPGSIRRIETVLDKKWLFGKYLATLAVIYGDQNEPLSYTMSFWVLPWRFLAGLSAALLILLIVLYRGRRRLGLALKILFTGDPSLRR